MNRNILTPEVAFNPWSQSTKYQRTNPKQLVNHLVLVLSFQIIQREFLRPPVAAEKLAAQNQCTQISQNRVLTSTEQLGWTLVWKVIVLKSAVDPVESCYQILS